MNLFLTQVERTDQNAAMWDAAVELRKTFETE